MEDMYRRHVDVVSAVTDCRQGRMPDCNHCGAHVSDQFARVFADEYGEVHACPSCSANAGIAEVARERAHKA
jgi:hypothetical protein